MAMVTIGVVGLGRMGGAVASRLVKAGYPVIGFDYSKEACANAAREGVTVVDALDTVAERCRVIWIMVPAGSPVDAVIAALNPQMHAGYILIDGGNSNFQDSIRRAKTLVQQNIFFLDCGTSGGLHGREIGFSLMVGGERDAYSRLLEMFKAVAAPHGVAYMGPSGTGHYVKMVHNGIEYALLQAYAEGLQLLKEGHFKDVPLDLATISDVWNHGSIIRSWILELAHDVLKKDQTFTAVSGEIQESGTGKWTVEEAHKHHIPVPLIEHALDIRAWSRESGGNYATKVVALLRNAFGGHAFKELSKKD